MIANLQLWKRYAWLLGLLVAVGCSRGGVTALNPTQDNLLKIGNAYRNAVRRLGRPPKDFQELQPSLEGHATEELFRSPNDGEPYVFILGRRLRQAAAGASQPLRGRCV